MRTSTTSLLLVALLGLSDVSAVETWTMKVNGTSRNLLVHAPSNVAGRPLLISMHGMNQDAAYQRNAALWETIADSAKFVVAFPNGLNKSWDISGTTDVAFLAAIIDTMARKYAIDRNRVYVSGFSMGGMMSYHAANKMADKVAAIAPVSGYLFANTVASSRPMPILHIHGTGDDVVGFSGVEGMLSKWRTWNGCPTTGQTIDPYPANKPGSVASRKNWGPCKNSAVSLIALEGKGHWYSTDAASVHSSVEIWNFVKQYSLGSATAVARTPGEAPYRIAVTTGTIVLEGAEPPLSVRLVDARGAVHGQWSPGSTWEGRLAFALPAGNPGIHFLDIRTSRGRDVRALPWTGAVR